MGDIMCHSSQLNVYHNKKTNSFSADQSFKYVSERLQSFDLLLGNLETTIVPKSADYSGYPRFGAPIGFLESVQKAGFHLLSTANNHSADKGEIGIDFTIESIFKLNMIPLGTFSSESDYTKRRHVKINKNDLQISIFNYTYSTNGIKVPKGRIVRLLDEQLIVSDLAEAKKDRSHLIIVWYHFGKEYSEEPNDEQKRWVTLALENGADIVLGGHPHVVQRFERQDHKFIAYSLGNFLSAQNHPYTDGGVILDLAIEITGEQKKIVSIDLIPVWVKPGSYEIIPIHDFLDGKVPIDLTRQNVLKLKQYHQKWKQIMERNRL
ncbi:hypothetical protein LPTSP4_28500 [Leptospira ryugenii]|uniref:Capsule synthesis protein CapA domain-containing protein n=1 Tax=Leptospira ryugenii TaxID=1917863 RepID=A0A2P2E353_9LEPT|nr:hypothetical protein LPTSP4_28500 [Leptospira ryugenii]